MFKKQTKPFIKPINKESIKSITNAETYNIISVFFKYNFKKTKNNIKLKGFIL
jgi:hypothetical protein